MAYLAIRGSGAINGVSKLHGQVSRRLFQPLFPRWPETEVPVTHVTNGVHTPTWDSAEADSLWELSCGKQFWYGTLADAERDIRAASDSSLWQLRAGSRKTLVEYVRRLYGRQLAARGASSGDLAQAALIPDDNILTLGFARRLCHIQTPEPSSTRSSAASEHPDKSRASCSTRACRQGSSPRCRGARNDPAMVRVCSPP